MNTGIPISSDLRLAPGRDPGQGGFFALEWNSQAILIDPPPGISPPEGAAALVTAHPNPVLPEGVAEIPFPPGKGFYTFLRIGNLLFAGAAPSALPELSDWEALGGRIPPDALLLSSGLPPMSLGAFLDRLRAFQ